MFWSEAAAVFLLGVSGTGHCLGMCGAFALAVANGSKKGWELVGRQAAYQAGKATSYAFLGLLLLLAARWAGGVLPYFRNGLGVLLGVAMIAVGLAYALEWRWPAGAGRWWRGGEAGCGLWAARSLPGSLLLGWVNGFLPCGLSMMALASLAAEGSVGTVVAGAYVFGFSTMPGLLALAWAGRGLSVERRRWLVRIGGVALVLFGVLTLVRGAPAVHAWMHAHLMPAAAKGAPEFCHP